jgi:hypothetical protein
MRFYLIATQFIHMAQQFHDSLYVAYCLFLFVFWSSGATFGIVGSIVFLFVMFSSGVFMVSYSAPSSHQKPSTQNTVGPQKGAIQAQSQAIYRDLNHDG